MIETQIQYDKLVNKKVIKGNTVIKNGLQVCFEDKWLIVEALKMPPTKLLMFPDNGHHHP